MKLLREVSLQVFVLNFAGPKLLLAASILVKVSGYIIVTFTDERDGCLSFSFSSLEKSSSSISNAKAIKGRRRPKNNQISSSFA